MPDAEEWAEHARLLMVTCRQEASFYLHPDFIITIIIIIIILPFFFLYLFFLLYCLYSVYSSLRLIFSVTFLRRRHCYFVLRRREASFY